MEKGQKGQEVHTRFVKRKKKLFIAVGMVNRSIVRYIELEIDERKPIFYINSLSLRSLEA